MDKIDVQIFCCGLFHYRNYVENLVGTKTIHRFTFSLRRSTFSGQPWAKNIWLKEYAVGLLTKCFSDSTNKILCPYIHDYWQLRVMTDLKPARLAHVMLPGMSPSFLRQLKDRGSIILGEAVNTHPENHYSVLRSEASKFGINMPPDLSKQWKRVRDCTPLCDWLLTPSTHVTQSYIERGFPKSRIITMPFGGNIHDFRPPADSAPRRNLPMEVACVAQVIPRKGIHYLVEAWAKLGLPPNKARLRIIGRISHEMRDLPRRSGPGVEFLGAIGRQKVAEILQQASVFVLPTLEEGFAYVILEAMASGCAIITTTEAGADDVITAGENGLLVPPYNSKALRDALRSLYDNPEIRERLGDAAFRTAKHEYNWETYAKRLSALYQFILGSANASVADA